MRIAIHVDDIAEVFVRTLLADAPRYNIYNSGGTPISLGELANLVRAFLPTAQITFEHEQGGKERSGNYLIDNSRLLNEFEIEYPPFRQRVLEIINAVRQEEGEPLLSA
jgi:nucleoside-diphosphate-sugar epimerase